MENLPEGGNGMHFQEMADNLGLELDEFNALVALFIETSRKDINQMTTALEHADADRMVELAHSLKGSAGNLGFVSISAEAKQLEINARNNNLKDTVEQIRILHEKLDSIEQVLCD